MYRNRSSNTSDEIDLSYANFLFSFFLRFSLNSFSMAEKSKGNLFTPRQLFSELIIALVGSRRSRSEYINTIQPVDLTGARKTVLCPLLPGRSWFPASGLVIIYTVDLNSRYERN